MTRKSAAVLLFWALASTACQTKKVEPGAQPAVSATTNQPPDTATIERERELVRRGQPAGSNLPTPSVRADRQGVTVGGGVVAAASTLTGAPRALEPLNAWLRVDREHWQQLYPGKEFAGRAKVEVTGDASGWLGLSVIGTVALAGYGATVESDSSRFDVTVGRAGPISAAVVELGASNVLRFEGATGCRLPTVAKPLTDPSSLSRAVEEVCEPLGPPCFEALVVQAAESAKFVDIAGWMAAVLGSGVAKRDGVTYLPSLQGVELRKCDQADAAAIASVASPAETDAGCDSNKLKPPKVVAREVRSSGPIASSEAAAVLRKAHADLTACYNAGRCSNPKLRGFFEPTLSIAPDGSVVRFRTGTDIAEAGVAQCMLNAIRKLRFPAKQEATAEIAARWDFAPQ